jgi:hypothetical protein
MEQQVYSEIRRHRKNLILALIAAIVIIDSAVLLSAGSDIEFFISDLSRIGTIGAAVVLSLVVVRRQGVGGFFGKAYVMLAAGLILWMVAESIWGYYELVIGEETPFPSIADAFWLSAYGPIGYHIFSTSKFFGSGVKKPIVVAVSAAAIVFSYFYLQAVIDISTLEGPDALLGVVISILYPVFDAIVLIPVILIITNAGRGQLTSIPWIFVSMLLLVVADSLLGLTAVVDFAGQTFHITMIYNAAYLGFMAGLLWYNKQFLLNEKRLVK